MPASLTKPLIVPQWDSKNVVLYTPGTQLSPLGKPVPNANFTVDQTVLSPLFNNTAGSPNVCIIDGTDLYIAVNGNAQGIVKLPGYVADPLTAKSKAFVLDLNLSDYVGLAVDTAGNLYAAAGQSIFGGPGNNIVFYPGARAATHSIPGTSLGNAGVTSYFGNLVFDSSGNLWAADYHNNRLVVFEQSTLQGAGPATWVALGNPANATPLAVANTVAGFPAHVASLFASPEGLDFDGFSGSASLWVANNNDGGNISGLQTLPDTTLVRINSPILTTLRNRLTNNPNTTLTADQFTANVDFQIYQVPTYSGAASAVPQFGGLQVDKSTGWLYVNDETNNPASGWVRAYNPAALASIPNNSADTSSQLISNAVTDQTGNGGIAMLGLGAYIGDITTTSDTGLEPDPSAAAQPWESPNIVATIDSGPQATLPAPVTDANGQDTVLGGVARNIYVKVNNFGPAPTTGLEQLHLYWAKGSGTLGWPQPWDGKAPPDPLNDLPSGGIITAADGSAGIPIPSIPASGSVIIGPVSWNTPDPTKYSVQDGHFCLLARVITPNQSYAERSSSDTTNPPDTSLLAFAGMSFPEVAGQHSDLINNVVKNARIAWRNIHLVAPDAGIRGAIRFPSSAVVARNDGAASLNLRIGFELLDAERRPVLAPGRPLLVSATGRSLEVLERSGLEVVERDALDADELGVIELLERAIERLARDVLNFLTGGATGSRPRQGHFRLRDFAAGIGGIHLAPGENLMFHVAYAAAPEGTGYALRAKAFAHEAGRERLVGGQTFVYGEVAGFGGGHSA